MVESILELFFRDVVSVCEGLLYDCDVLANADWDMRLALYPECLLDVVCGCEVVGVRVCLEEIGDLVSALADDLEKCIGRFGADCEGCLLEVKDGVYDGRFLGFGAGDDILPGTCFGLKDGMHDRVHFGVNTAVVEAVGLGYVVGVDSSVVVPVVGITYL